jgi:hypothetical protein
MQPARAVSARARRKPMGSFPKTANSRANDGHLQLQPLSACPWAANEKARNLADTKGSDEVTDCQTFDLTKEEALEQSTNRDSVITLEGIYISSLFPFDHL